jgi:hypothetical protein
MFPAGLSSPVYEIAYVEGVQVARGREGARPGEPVAGHGAGWT